jgi:hypothetical protein
MRERSVSEIHVDRGVCLPAGRGEVRVRSWGLSRKRDEAWRSVKTGVTRVGVGARITAVTSLALAHFTRQHDKQN